MSSVIRHAASVIAVREVRDGAEVLVIERSADARFLPGYVAFPGGAVEDRDAELGVRWFGSVAEAARACAVRELMEEVGLAPAPVGLGPAATNSVEGHGAVTVSAERLPRLARWVAPPDVPVRFDAEYFAIDAGYAVDPVPDGQEAAAAWWISPARLLADWQAGACRLYWPTYFTVRRLSGCSTAADVLALRFETREPDEDDLARLPRSVFWQDGE